MATVDEATPVPRSRLLSALPPDDFARLSLRLKPVAFKDHEIVHRQGEPVRTIYFPESGWFSILSLLSDGSSAEVGIVGSEGMVGMTVLLGGRLAGVEARVQCPGTALSMNAAAFCEELDRSPAFRAILLRYGLARYLHAIHLAACNARHQVNQRLARKLLMAHDRADSDEFLITHESLAIMLGVRRPGVSVAAAQLQRAGLIRYVAGHVTVTNRAGLEAFACECYGVIRADYEQLLGPAAWPRTAYRR